MPEENTINENRLAKWSLYSGILAFLFVIGYFSVWIGQSLVEALIITLGLTAIIAGVAALKQINSKGQTNKIAAIEGIVLGILSLVLLLLFLTVIVPAIGDIFQNLIG